MNNIYIEGVGEFEKMFTYKYLIKKCKEATNFLKLDLKKHKKEEIVFLVVLKGANRFFGEITRKLNIPDIDIKYISLSSYNGGIVSTGDIKTKDSFDFQELKDKVVFIFEDILDSGITINYLKAKLEKTKNIYVYSLFYNNLRYNLKEDEKAFIPTENNFIIGFGLDYQNKYRITKDIYKKI